MENPFFCILVCYDGRPAPFFSNPIFFVRASSRMVLDMRITSIPCALQKAHALTIRWGLTGLRGPAHRSLHLNDEPHQQPGRKTPEQRPVEAGGHRRRPHHHHQPAVGSLTSSRSPRRGGSSALDSGSPPSNNRPILHTAVSA